MQFDRPISLTVGFPRTRAMEVLGASATANGFQFVGLPNVWKAESLKKIDKFTLIKHFLASGNVSPDAVILFTDAYDVLIADRATRVVQLFARTGCDLIF